MNFYKDKTYWKEVLSFRPYRIGEKAHVVVRDPNVLVRVDSIPTECARFTKDQWIAMDRTVVNVSRPLLGTLSRLRRDGFCFYPPVNYDESKLLFIHKDCDANYVSAAYAVATKAEQVAQYVFDKGSIEQLYVFLDMTLIQKSPVCGDESTWNDDVRLSVVFGFYTPDPDLFVELCSMCEF